MPDIKLYEVFSITVLAQLSNHRIKKTNKQKKAHKNKNKQTNKQKKPKDQPALLPACPSLFVKCQTTTCFFPPTSNLLA